MKYSAQEVIQYVNEEDVKFIRLAFCDVYGRQKNISISTSASAPATMKFYEGWTSPVYKEKIQRPSYAVTAFKKAGRKLVFDTLITPVN